MMQYIGVVLFILCLVHYVYQAILLPSFRQAARDELFILRDRLRARLIEIQDTADKRTIRAFREVDDGINRSLNRLHTLTFSGFLKASISFKTESKIHEEKYKKFHTLLDSASDEMPNKVYAEVGEILLKVLSLNSLMFVMYLLPVYVVAKLVGSVYQRITAVTSYMLEETVVARTSRISSERVYA